MANPNHREDSREVKWKTLDFNWDWEQYYRDAYANPRIKKAKVSILTIKFSHITHLKVSKIQINT